MYRLSKRVISQYIRSGCKRRLRLDLFKTDRDRMASDAPTKDSSRPGLALLTRQGKEYERAKFAELESIFPDHIVRGELKPFAADEDRAFAPIQLADHIGELVRDQFVLEAQYGVTPTFVSAHGLLDLMDGTASSDGEPLIFESLRPDILHVLPANGDGRRIITPSGRIERIDRMDPRLGLRIVDIKISGEASPAHFAELAYYGMVLAAWLIDEGHADRFVVLAEAAIWPGKHDGSTMHLYDREDRAANVPTRDLARYLDGLNADLEVMPPEVVIGRVQRFLEVDLREALAVADWRRLAWHIDSRCSGCDYLGYRWSRHDSEVTETAPPVGPSIDSRYCWPMAADEGHLSRLAGLTEGASGKLRESNIENVGAVSGLPAGSPAFERHQTLRAKRTVLRQRAVTLEGDLAADVADRAGTSAVLPKFADIRVAVSADFDIGSGLTFAFGYRVEYGVPNAFRPQGQSGPAYGREYRTIERPLLVPDRTLESEGEIVRLWLDHLVHDVHEAREAVVSGYRANGSSKTDATLQFFLWDRLTFDHICRVFGRHLDRLQTPARVGMLEVSPMAWVFPAESVVQEPNFIGRSSPITIVSDAVNSLIAAPIPHHYGVLDLANSIDPNSRVKPNGERWSFHINKFYRDPLSDQIPSERGHEIWERQSPFPDRDFQWHQETVRSVVRRKLMATNYVAQKLTHMLSEGLTADAPQVSSVFQRTRRLDGVGDDGQIIYQHAKLTAAAQRLEIDLLMAMPPHEREARFKSARVDAVLSGQPRTDVLTRLRRPAMITDPAILVLRLCERSREARLKVGDFNWSFLPEADLEDLQELTTAQFKTWRPALVARNPTQDWDYRRKVREDLSVTILDIDRSDRLLVVRASSLLTDAMQRGYLSMDLDGELGRYGILDPFALDVFTPKLKKALSDRTGIRNPPAAQARPLFPVPHVARVASGAPRRGVSNGPAAEFLWNADVMARTTTSLSGPITAASAARIVSGLTVRQREAVVQATERRLSLWWGPPGTGKSRTAQAYIAALVAEAVRSRAPLRIAILGFTWVAIDNVARRLPELFRAEGVQGDVVLARLAASAPVTVDRRLTPHLLYLEDGDAKSELERRLSEAQAVTVVATTVQQLAKLGQTVCAPLFDVILIDEASQLDVGHLVVGLTKLADQGRVTVVGDDKQMAPIHPMEAPKGIEHLLGSSYDFYKHYRIHEGEPGLQPIMLDQSFRSNREIIEFVREAGYGDELRAAEGNAGLRFRTATPLPSTQPPAWPASLPWTDAYAAILDPEDPLAAVVHRDRYSSQRNDEEADLVAGLVLSLFRAGLHDVADPVGPPLDPNDFFRKGVGIVTPHRAQQAAVYDRLDRVLPPEVDRNELFATVDTVERFQGQEKTVMLASFGLGDADQIAAEETFLYSLNRFNVAASRAQAKFIAVVSRQLVDHLPRDRRALEESRLLKHYVDGFLSRRIPLSLPGLGSADLKLR